MCVAPEGMRGGGGGGGKYGEQERSLGRRRDM